MRIRIQLFALMWIRIQFFTLMRIRTQFLSKIMGICGHWSTDPPGLHFEPLGPRLYASTALHGSILRL
jgi:hypothetical protein